MKEFKTIQPIVYLLGLAGLGLLIALLVREGAGQVALAIAHAGWGLLVLVPYHLLQTLSDSAGWLILIPKENRIPMTRNVFIHWIGESINNLLPTARVGGDIVIARIAAMWGVPLSAATAAIIVDVTIGIVTKVGYIVVACVLLIGATGRTDMVRPSVVVAVAGALAVTGFYGVQRAGVFKWGALLASRVAKSPAGHSLVQRGESLDQAIRLAYARPYAIAGCSFFWVTSWLIACGEIWIALRALGLRPSFATAVILESGALAIRGAAFLVPGAVGVQEGGFILLGNLLGISGEIALAVSLLRRARELALGIPGLIAWQLLEAGRLWRRPRGEGAKEPKSRGVKEPRS